MFVNTRSAKRFVAALMLHHKHSLFWENTSYGKEYVPLMDHVPNNFVPPGAGERDAEGLDCLSATKTKPKWDSLHSKLLATNIGVYHK